MTTHAMNLEAMARRPWLMPERWSIWSASGVYPDGGRFHDLVVLAVPSEDRIVFWPLVPHLMGPFYGQDRRAGMSEPLDPAQVRHARRLLLVHADDPRRAYLAGELLIEQDLQGLIDQEAGR
jgi:hypothetical protein